MTTDPIADMLTRIRNASMAHKKEVVVPFSNIKMKIAVVLAREGYLNSAEETNTKPKGIAMSLKYNGRVPVIGHIKRISKPGSRVYIKKDDIKEVLGGFGFSIISTPRGILTNQEARSQNVGGEIVCEVF